MNKGGVLFKGNKSICYLKKEGMMPDNVVENKEEVFIIRLVGMKPGTSSEQLEAVIMRMVPENQRKSVGQALKKLPLVLSRKASKKNAAQVKQLLESKGGILEITPVSVKPKVVETSAPLSTKEETPSGSPAKPMESKPEVSVKEPGESEYSGPDRRSKPRVHKGISLVPMRIGELLDRTFRLMRENFWMFFLIILIPQGIYFVASSVLRFVLSDFLKEHAGPAMTVAWGASFFLVAIIFAVIQLWAQGALIHAISEKYLGHLTSIGLAYGAAKKRLWGLIGTSLLMVLLMVLCLALPGVFLAIIVPVLAKAGLPKAVSILVPVIGILFLLFLFFYIFMNWLLMDKVVILERMSGMRALRRSKELMTARTEPGFWRSTKMKAGFILLCVLAIGIGFHLLVQVPGIVLVLFMKASLIAHTLSEALGVIANSLTTLIGAIAMILYYYDIRVRKEGFDLKMMAENI
jgi:hypothetical protein